MSRPLNEREILVSRNSRFVRVERKSAEHFLILCEDRLRPRSSYAVPNHRVTIPLWSSRGSRRSENHRNTPSNRRSRTSQVSVTISRDPSQSFSSPGRSSGWIAACQPSPYDCSEDKPVYSSHRLLTKSTEQSGRLDHASAGIVLMMVRNSLRELRISPSTVSIFSRASIWCRPRFSHAEAGPGQNPVSSAQN